MVTIKRREDTVFRAVADPTRRQILDLLRRGQRTVGDLAGNFETSRPAISKHLRLLRSAGLVVTRKRGTASVCTLNPKPLKSINRWLHNYEALWGQSLRKLKQYVEEEQ